MATKAYRVLFQPPPACYYKRQPFPVVVIVVTFFIIFNTRLTVCLDLTKHGLSQPIGI